MPGRSRWGEIAHSWRVSVAQAIAPRTTRIIPVDAPSPPPQHTPKPLSISPPSQSSAHRRHYEIRTKVSNRYPLTTFSAVLNPKGLRGSQAALILSLNHRTRLLRVGSVYLEVPAQFTPLTEAWIQWFALWFWRERFKDGTVTFGSGNALAVAILEGSWPRPGHNIRRKIPPAVASAIHTAISEVAASHNIVLQHKVIPHAENNLAYHLSRCDTPELRASALMEEQREQVEESEKMMESMGMELLGDPVPGGHDTVPSVVPKHQASDFSVFSITRFLPLHAFRRITSSVANLRADIRDWRIAAARALSSDPNLIPKASPKLKPTPHHKLRKTIFHHSAPTAGASAGRTQSKRRTRSEAGSQSESWQEHPHFAVTHARGSTSPLGPSELSLDSRVQRAAPARSGAGRTLSRRRAQAASQRVDPKPGFGLRSASAPHRLTRPPKSAPLIPKLPVPPRPKIPITSGARDISLRNNFKLSNPPYKPDAPPISSIVPLPTSAVHTHVEPELGPESLSSPISVPELSHTILPPSIDRPQYRILTYILRQGRQAQFTTFTGALYSVSTEQTSLLDAFCFTFGHTDKIRSRDLSAFAMLFGVTFWSKEVAGGRVTCMSSNKMAIEMAVAESMFLIDKEEWLRQSFSALACLYDVQIIHKIARPYHTSFLQALVRPYRVAYMTKSIKQQLAASLERIDELELKGFEGMHPSRQAVTMDLNDDEKSTLERSERAAAYLSENIRILLKTAERAAHGRASARIPLTSTEMAPNPSDVIDPSLSSNGTILSAIPTPTPPPLPFKHSLEWMENEDDLIETTPPARQPSLVIPSQSLIEAIEIDPFSPANAPPPRVIRTENEIRTHVYRQGSFTTFAGVLYLRGTDLAGDSFVFTLDHNSAPLRVGSSTFASPYHTTTLSAYAMLFAATFWRNRVAGDLLICSTVNERATIIAKAKWAESRGVNTAIGQAVRDLSQGYGIEFQFDDIPAKDIGLARMITRCHSLIGRRRMTDRIQLQLAASDQRIMALKVEGYVDRTEEIPFVAPDPNQEFYFDLPPVFPPLSRPTPQAYVSARETGTFHT